MERLSFRKKFIVLNVLFVIPIAWLMTIYVADNFSSIEFTEKERVGVKFLKDIFPVSNGVAKVRGLTNAYLNGNTALKSKIENEINTVNSNFNKLATTENNLTEYFTSKTTVASLRKQWDALYTNALSKSAKQNFVLFTDFNELLFRYIAHIADVSNLILDPELDSYYVMDAVVIQSPQLFERLGIARGIGVAVATKKSFTPDEFTQLSGYIHEIKLFGDTLSENLSKAYQVSPKLKETLGQYEDNFHKKQQEFILLTQTKLINADSVTIDSTSYFNAGTDAIEEGNALLSAMLPALDGLLEKRIDSREFIFYQTVIVITVISLLVAYLFTSFSNSVLRNINNINSTVDELSNGNFQVSANVTSRDEVGSVADKLNAMILKINSLVSQVMNSANQVASAADQASATAAQAQDGINRQNSEIEQVATAINEMSATVHEVAQNTANAAELTQTADGEANNGRAVVSQAIDSINRLAGEMESSSQVIQDLETQSESIGTVLDVIRGIAEQTNLLALNAAIEAARAGEQGRGFAVVADEVRTLASRTQESTEEINNMIAKLQTGARNAVEAMAQGTQQTDQSVEQAVQAGAALDQISTAVTTIHDMNTQIASAAEEQSSVSEEINRNIVNIRDIAEATVQGANQTAQSSEAMSEVARELIGLVNEFKV